MENGKRKNSTRNISTRQKIGKNKVKGLFYFCVTEHKGWLNQKEKKKKRKKKRKKKKISTKTFNKHLQKKTPFQQVVVKKNKEKENLVSTNWQYCCSRVIHPLPPFGSNDLCVSTSLLLWVSIALPFLLPPSLLHFRLHKTKHD